MDSGGLIIGLSIAVPVANRSFCASFSVSNQVLWDSRPFNRARQSLGAATTDGVYVTWRASESRSYRVHLTFVSQYVVIDTYRTFPYSEGVTGSRSGSLRISEKARKGECPLRG